MQRGWMARIPKDRTKALWVGVGGVFLLAAWLYALGFDNEPDQKAPVVTDTASSAEIAGDATPRPARPPRADLGIDGGKLITATIVLAIALAVGLVLLKRFLAKTRLAPGGEKTLRVLDAIPLGSKASVYVVSAYGRKLIIGAGGDSLSLLTEFNEDEIEASVRSADFQDKLEQTLAVGAAETATLEVNA